MLSALSRFAFLVLAAILGGLVVYWLIGSPDRTSTDRALLTEDSAAFLPHGQLATVTQMPAAARIRLGGYVEPRSTIRLTAQAPGRVVFVAGQEGERITAGQVAVALDDDAMRPEYRAAWAQLTGEMVNIQNAQTQLYQNLYGPKQAPLGGPGYAAYEQATVPFYNMAQGFMQQFMPGFANGPNSFFPGSGGPMTTQAQSQRDWAAVNNARAAYENQLVALSAAQSKLDMIDARMRDRLAVAPRSSAIMNRFVRVGDIVQPGQPLMDIADVDNLDVRIEVPATQIGNLAVGEVVPVSLDDRNIWAPVSQIFPAANATQRTVTVKLSLPAGTAAAPGMYAVAWIAQPGGGSPSELAPAIPTTAIVQRGSLPVAYVVDRRGNVELRVLRLGDTQGDRTAVLSGLEPGEQVLLKPGYDLKAGKALASSAE